MSGKFDVAETPLAGLKLITRKPIGDARGFLERMFCTEDLAEAGVDWQPVQVNRTLTQKAGTVRGMHFQRPPHAEVKFVHCLRGAVYDVAVDLRRGSPTYGKWSGAELSADNHRALLIPRGFAHGFQTLIDDVEMLYFHSTAYAPAAEGGVNHADPRLAIAWPLPIAETSARDAALPQFTEDFESIYA